MNFKKAKTKKVQKILKIFKNEKYAKKYSNLLMKSYLKNFKSKTKKHPKEICCENKNKTLFENINII